MGRAILQWLCCSGILALSETVDAELSGVSLTTEMVPSQIVIRNDCCSPFTDKGQSFIEAAAERVSRLTDLAMVAGRIDKAKAENAHRRPEGGLYEQLANEEVASVNAPLVRSLAQLHANRWQHK